jgi:tRNA1Val (adenine37-N6)-methyltransferase
MANSWFKFKQFTINQGNCAMKVGTDGVLIGTWTTAPRSGLMLDVGTGTGLIALIMAQRSPQLKIKAIEIDSQASSQAIENSESSPWSDRISIENTSLQSLAKEASTKFDLIISNPPFFNTSKPSPDAARNTARQTRNLTLDELFAHSADILKHNGIISLILPFDQKDIASQIAKKHQLYPKRTLHIKPTPSKPFHRFITEYCFTNQLEKIEDLIIEDGGRHCYSKKYKLLTNDFYLK